MNGDNRTLTYPNAVLCSIGTSSSLSSSSSGGGSRAIFLSRACFEVMNMSLPEPHNFSLEQSIVEKDEKMRNGEGNTTVDKNNEAPGSALASSMSTSSGTEASSAGIEAMYGSDLSDDKRNKIVKMKSITSANEEICHALLEEHEYELQRAVDAFFRSG